MAIPAAGVTIAGVVALLADVVSGRKQIRARDKLLGEQNEDVLEALRALEARFEEVQLLNATLETKVRDRTSELHVTSERLAASLAQQVELDRLKTQFFQNISHELRTPLTLILAPLETLLSTGHPPHVLHELETIHRSGLRLLKNINALLDLSRLDAGRERLRLESTDISEFISGIVDSAQGLANQREVKLTFSRVGSLSPFPIDRDKVEKIVLNLLSNALKFTHSDPKGSPTVKVRCGSEGARCWIEVEDSGVGMPGDQLEKIFERFHQVDGSISRSHEGTGIGLSLVKEFVILHHGEVKVTSRLGLGTTFRVELPMAPSVYPVEATDRRHGSVPVSIDRRETGGLQRLRELVRDPTALTLSELSFSDRPQTPTDEDPAKPLVLIADDNRDMLQYLSRLLSGDYRVRTAEDGEQALQLARSTLPAIILSDMMMPKKSGQQVLVELRKDPRTRHIPVIFVTARAEAQQKVEGLDEGADDYLTKPFNFLELKARIRSLLNQRRLERELQEKKLELAKFVSHETVRTIDAHQGAMGRVGHRERVTVLFSDVRGFTSFAESHQPEEVVTVLNQYLQVQSDVVNRYGGDIDKFIGDELMARFVGPEAERRAAACAVDMVQAVNALAAERPLSSRLSIGIGINVGEVVLGAIGSDKRMDFTVTGDAVNLASRLCSAAKPSQVLVSSSLRDSLNGQDVIEADPLEAIRVRGKQEPVPVFELRRRGVIKGQPIARTQHRTA